MFTFSQLCIYCLGKHAYQFGVEACLRLYKDKMPAGIELQKNTVKRLRDLFLAANRQKFPLEEEEDDEEGEENHEENGENATNNHQKFRVFDANLKDDIGRYAFHCGNTNAVHHFSNKLRFPMKESTVRKFKKVWMEKNGVEVMDASNTATANNDPDEDDDHQRQPSQHYVMGPNLELIHGEVHYSTSMTSMTSTIQIGKERSPKNIKLS